MPVPTRRARAAGPTLAACGALTLCGCSGGVLDPAGPVGRANARILIDATLIMLVIVVPTILLALWMAWRYRASNTKAEYLPYWSFSGRIEAIVWSIPILVIMFISGEIWIGSHKLDPFRPLPSNTPPLQVQVVALDWKWLFIYPEQGVASVNQLVVPAGRPVHFSLTSASVMNVFFVPRLGTMVYAMPGMVSQLHLQADRPELLYGRSAQFSGDGFSAMEFQVHSLDPAGFATWAQTARTAPPLDQAAWSQLMRQTEAVRPVTFGAVDPQLFQAIATLRIGPQPGPHPEGSGHAGREGTPAGRR